MTNRKDHVRTFARGPDRLTIVIDRGGFVWEYETIIAALKRWSRRHGGRTPTYNDLKGPSRPARERPSPFNGSSRPEYPSTATVVNYFGSFPAGIRAAGLEPVGRAAGIEAAAKKRRAQMHCKRGHLLPEPAEDGTRRCRPCTALRSEEYRQRAHPHVLRRNLTHCPHGHELPTERNRFGRRRCTPCANDRAREYQRRRKAEARA